MNGYTIKALLIISLAVLATGCRVAIIVPTGGNVVSSNGAYNCPEASVCEFEVTEAPFSETFTAQASPGYEFEKWSNGADFLCGKSTNPTCVVSLPDVPVVATIIAFFDSSYVMPIFKDIGIDTDLDGIRNELDEDDDNDGVLDADDNCPLEGPNLDGFGCPILSKTVFVTSESYTGNLGGLAGADQKCNDLAAAASLSGDYKAWLSDGIEAPSTRFTQSPDVSYQLVDGTVIAVGYDGVVATELLAPMNLTEQGDAKSSNVWTNTFQGQPGTLPEGFEPVPGLVIGSCDAWTSPVNPVGQVGALFGTSSGAVAQGGSGGWEIFGTTYSPCSLTAALYCFEQ